MTKATSYLLVCLAFICQVSANVEKTIFLAPAAEPPPPDASIDNLLLPRLSPQYPSVRTFINASFRVAGSPKGTQTWLLIEGLQSQKRYEVRICWLATVSGRLLIAAVRMRTDSSKQPTSLWLCTHSVRETFETPELLTSLSTYSYARHERLDARDRNSLQARKADPADRDATYLFLQIFAAADYFSLNDTLMETVPPVAVDIILDPFILNVLPQSLLPIGLYLVVIAVGAWLLSGWISRLLAYREPGLAERESKKSK